LAWGAREPTDPWRIDGVLENRKLAATDEGERVILEFTQLGCIVRVSAMDPATLIEVVIQGPASAGEEALRRIALRKLGWALKRSRRPRSAG
jgi:hypothetical protein